MSAAVAASAGKTPNVSTFRKYSIFELETSAIPSNSLTTTLLALFTITLASESAPEDPTLVQVVYVTRHGLRTPLSDSNDLMKSLPWECVSAEETLRAFTEDLELYRADEGPERGIHPSKVSRSRLPPGRFDAQFNGDKLSDFGKNCHSGQLTLAGHLVRPRKTAWEKNKKKIVFLCRFSLLSPFPKKKA